MRIAARGRLVGVLAAVAAVASSGLAAVSSRAGVAAPDAAASRVITAARAHVGDRYQWGGSGPDVWDCSGFVSTLWRTVGKVASVPRTSRDQASWAIPVPPAQALPGDLVFFGSPVSHVGIYLGDGRMVDASQSRGQVVLRAVYPSRVIRYGRVPRPTAPPVRGTPKPVPTPAPEPPPVLNPVPPLGYVSRVQAHPAAIQLAKAARTRVGARYATGGRAGTFDAAGLVHWSCATTGRAALPLTPAAIEARTRPVRVRELATGDLVFYGRPAVHVGVYVGRGRMVDASRVLRRVVLRPVFASETVRFGRLVRAPG